MRTTLRVLGAITDRQPPDVADLEELRRLDPAQGDCSPDELACNVILKALKDREQVRKSLLE